MLLRGHVYGFSYLFSVAVACLRLILEFFLSLIDWYCCIGFGTTGSLISGYVLKWSVCLISRGTIWGFFAFDVRIWMCMCEFGFESSHSSHYLIWFQSERVRCDHFYIRFSFWVYLNLYYSVAHYFWVGFFRHEVSERSSS